MSSRPWMPFGVEGMLDLDLRWLAAQVRPSITYQATAVALTVGASVLSLANPLLLKVMIDTVLPRRQWDALLLVAISLAITSVGRTLCGSATALVTARGVARCVRTLRRRVLRQTLALPPSFHGHRSTGDLAKRIEEDAASICGCGFDLAPRILDVLVQAVVIVGAMIVLDWRLTLIVAPFVAVFVWSRSHYKPSLLAQAEVVRDTIGAQSSFLVEVLSGATQVQLLGAEDRLTRRYVLLDMRSERARYRQQIGEMKVSLTRTSVVMLGTAAIMTYGGMRVLTGDLTAGGLIAYYAYAGSMFGPITAAAGLIARLDRVRAGIRRLREIGDAFDEVRDPPTATPLESHPASIECRDVTFGYVPDRLAVENVTFTVRRGERLAVLGPSGCGKSSLLKLLPRLYDGFGGRILVDNIDIGMLQRCGLRRSISFVPQDPVVFRGTIHDNLRHGSPGASAADLQRAMEIACLEFVIERLPSGLDTELGPMGAGLSGGERQRLAIARAILQCRPILILDEATSALDLATEQRLLQRLEHWCAERIVIVVGHRPSIADWAKRTVLLEAPTVGADTGSAT